MKKVYWRTVKEINEIPQHSVVEQVSDMNIKSSILSNLTVLRRGSPHSKFVVCDNDGKQVILVVGRDIIPHSTGVIPNRS